MRYPIIADSGANYHMFRDKEFFKNLAPASGKVILGDGTTTLDIQGIGTVECSIDGHHICIPNVRYIPSLAESIYSLFLHVKTPDHGLDSSFERGLFLRFPGFETKAILGQNDIHLNALPMNDNISSFGQDCDSSTSDLPMTYCCHLKEFQSTVNDEATYLDNLLSSLRNYYQTVKTKQQLDLEIPAGFHRLNNHQRLFGCSKLPPHASKEMESLSDIMESNTPLDPPSNTIPPEELTPTSSSINIVSPIIRAVDKASSSLPSKISLSEDYIRGCIGFRRIDTVKQYFQTFYQDTVSVDHTPPDAILDIGAFATMKKKARNTKPVPRSSYFGETVHFDIVFGPDISVGNIHYGPLFSDRCSRMTYVYPLQNLTTDIPRQLEAFFAHIGRYPSRLISDFDLKLIGGKAREFLNSLLIHVNAAPAHRQDKNGLAERHWQTIVAMARNWLASAELPPSFWFYAIHHAAEVCNNLPFRLEDGTYTTPFEIAHQQKPDLRVLIKPFALAAVRRERHGDNNLNKFESQSLPMITVGRCPNSNGLQFFNPANGTFVSSIDYVFQHNVTSGAKFGYSYQPGTFIYRLDETTAIFAPKFSLDSEVLVHTHSPPHRARIVG
jgi:hypothetical protein